MDILPKLRKSVLQIENVNQIRLDLEKEISGYTKTIEKLRKKEVDADDVH